MNTFLYSLNGFWAQFVGPIFGIVCLTLFLAKWSAYKKIGIGIWISIFLMIVGHVIRLTGFMFCSGFDFVIQGNDKFALNAWKLVSNASYWTSNIGLGALVFFVIRLRASTAKE